MSRDAGFAIADVASGHLDDEKVRKLWRRLGSQAEMCEAVTLHLAVVLASWREGRRVTAAAATPLWLTASPESVAALVAVGLLDRTHRVPLRTWTEWFGAATARREARREAGRRGGLARGKQSGSNASALLNPTGRQAGPSVPTVPTDRTPPTPPGGRRAQSANGRPEKVADLLGGYQEFVASGKASA